MTTIDKLPINEKMAAVLEDMARLLRAGHFEQALLDSAAMELEEKSRALAHTATLLRFGSSVPKVLNEAAAELEIKARQLRESP